MGFGHGMVLKRVRTMQLRAVMVERGAVRARSSGHLGQKTGGPVLHRRTPLELADKFNGDGIQIAMELVGEAMDRRGIFGAAGAAQGPSQPGHAFKPVSTTRAL